MSCARHHYKPCGRAPFQRVIRAAWTSEYCPCGAVQHHLVSPVRGEIEVDQPVHVTHAVTRNILPRSRR